MGRTDAVAVGDRRKSLDVGAEETSKHLGLGLTHLGELLGHVGDRAVVLAHLGAGRSVADRRCVAVLTQRVGEHMGTLLGLDLREQWAVAVLEVGQPMTRERHDGVLSTALLEVAQRPGGQLVVGVLEVVSTRIGDDVDLGRASTATLSNNALLAGHQDTVRQEVIEMASYGSGRQSQLEGEVRGCRWAVLENGGGHALTRRRVVAVRLENSRRVIMAGVFHKTSVPLFTKWFQRR